MNITALIHEAYLPLTGPGRRRPHRIEMSPELYEEWLETLVPLIPFGRPYPPYPTDPMAHARDSGIGTTFMDADVVRICCMVGLKCEDVR